MFKAMGKYVRAFFYLITFRINKASETLRMNPGVMSANYDRIIDEKRGRINQYKDAIAAMIAQEESKKQKLKKLVEEISKLEKLKAGAAAKARKIAEQHGGDPVRTKTDSEYIRCQAAFKDFSSTLDEKQSRADELEADLNELIENVQSHKINIENQLRDLEKLKDEKHSATADVALAQQEQDLANQINGLAEDRTGEELRELRELRHKANANARISRELSGLDTQRNEDDFLAHIAESESNDEFEQLMNWAGKEDSPATESKERSQIPEN